jgi:hypothetical protein
MPQNSPVKLKETQQSPVYVSQQTILCPVIFFYFCHLLCLIFLRTGSEDPHRHEQEFLFYYFIYYLAISARLRFL